MKVLVLGATGYLGSNLCDYLLEQKIDVSCIVRISSDNNAVLRLKNKNVTVYYKEDGIKSILGGENRFDWVINTTCVYRQNENGYIDMLNANLIFPLEVLNYASAQPGTKFLTIGTGLPKDFNMYSYTKYSLSEFGKKLCEDGRLLFCELRAELFYGKNEPENRFLQMCYRKLSSDERLELTEGTQLRDIMRIEDLMQAVSCVMTYLAPRDYGYYVYDVGTGNAVSIRDIVKYMSQKLQSKSEIVFGAVPSRNNEPDCIANITALRDMGYEPKYSWRAGIDKIIEENKI